MSVCLRMRFRQQAWTSTQTGFGIFTLSGRRSRGTWGTPRLSWTECSESPPSSITLTMTSKTTHTFTHRWHNEAFHHMELHSLCTLLQVSHYFLPPSSSAHLILLPVPCSLLSPPSGLRNTWTATNQKKFFPQRSTKSWGRCAARVRRQSAPNRPRRRSGRDHRGRKNPPHLRAQTQWVAIQLPHTQRWPDVPVMGHL